MTFNEWYEKRIDARGANADPELYYACRRAFNEGHRLGQIEGWLNPPPGKKAD